MDSFNIMVAKTWLALGYPTDRDSSSNLSRRATMADIPMTQLQRCR